VSGASFKDCLLPAALRAVAAARPIIEVHLPKDGEMIELGTLALMSAVGGLLSVPVVLVQHKISGWLGRRRNKKGLCGSCRTKLYQDGAAPSRVGGVLYCPECIANVRLAWTAALWTVTILALALPVVGALGMVGLLPFITGGVSAGAIAGLLVPSVVLAGSATFQLRHLRKRNALAALEEEDALLQLPTDVE